MGCGAGKLWNRGYDSDDDEPLVNGLGGSKGVPAPVRGGRTPITQSADDKLSMANTVSLGSGMATERDKTAAAEAAGEEYLNQVLLGVAKEMLRDYR